MHKEMVVLGKWREVKDYGWLERPKMVQERDVWTASTRSDGEMVGEQERPRAFVLRTSMCRVEE